MKKIITLVLSGIAFAVSASEGPIVQIENGRLQGAIEYQMQVFFYVINVGKWF